MARPFTTIATVATVTSLMGATGALAATVTVDNFSVDQSVSATGGPTSSTVCSSEDNILGGCRYMQVATDGPSQNGTSLEASQSVLEFANNSSSTGTGWIVYDGSADRSSATFYGDVAGENLDVAVNSTGLGGYDFLMGMSDGFFEFSADNFDNLAPGALEFSAFAFDLSGNTVSYSESIDPLSFSPILAFSDFRSDWNDPNSGLGGFQFDNVGALAFRVDSTAVGFDGQITQITAAVVPLPASALLLLGGIGGFGGLAAAKRRRKS